MTPEQQDLLDYTIGHFEEVARQNRFPENRLVSHDTERCLICHPGRVPMDPFAVYLEVITQSIKVRRPALDQALIDAINEDLALLGWSERVSLQAIWNGDSDAVALWDSWVREAMGVGLGLLAIHSASSLEFDLDDEGLKEKDRRMILEKVEEIKAFQRKA